MILKKNYSLSYIIILISMVAETACNARIFSCSVEKLCILAFYLVPKASAGEL